MASTKMIDIRRGMVLNMNGHLWYCLDRDLNTPGNWRAILYLKLKNLTTGSITQERVHPDDKVDVVYLDTRDFTYSYKDGDEFVFMDAETFEQVSLNAEMVKGKMEFLRENDPVKITFYDNKALGVDLPQNVTLKVIETEPGIKGATAAAQTKAATLETGLVVQVPSFIAQGELIVIDTEDKKYIRRAKE
ncbi:MAG: elongation factor P [Gemmataceae bacterium]